MKPRYFVKRGEVNWMVLDRLKIKEMRDDVVAICVSRSEARAKAKELNDQDRPSATEEVRHDTRPD